MLAPAMACRGLAPDGQCAKLNSRRSVRFSSGSGSGEDKDSCGDKANLGAGYSGFVNG
jgi:hypothetical protein